MQAQREIVKNAFTNAFLTALYVSLIAAFLFYVPRISGVNGKDTVLIPVVMLSLLVFSVALVGVLLFGRPMLWYLDGRRKDALSLLFYTLVIFLVITIIFLLALFAISLL
jgi:hypothetical protein